MSLPPLTCEDKTRQTRGTQHQTPEPTVYIWREKQVSCDQRCNVCEPWYKISTCITMCASK